MNSLHSTLRVQSLAASLAAALVFLASRSWADGELLTDRPDFTETTVAVAPGSIQLEGGFTRSDLGSLTIWNAPEALLRVGFLRGAEIRLGLDYVWPAGSFEDGDVVDGYAGAKLELASGGAFGLALIPAIVVPELGEDDVNPELVLAWSRELGSPWSVGGILGYQWEGESNSLTLTVSLAAPIGQRFGGFLEWAAERNDDETGHLLHHGYTFGLGPNLQLDVHGGIGIDDDAPDSFIGAGFALRR